MDRNKGLGSRPTCEQLACEKIVEKLDQCSTGELKQNPKRGERSRGTIAEPLIQKRGGGGVCDYEGKKGELDLLRR